MEERFAVQPQKMVPPRADRPRSATIKDVARLAGVSISTVSRALTGSRPVRPHLQERVRQAASRLGYQPNAGARGLRQLRTMTLGIVFPSLESQVQLCLLRGLGRICQEHGYSLLVTDAQLNPQLYRTLMARLFERRVDGLFLVAPGELGDSLSVYRRSNVPVLAMLTKDESAADIPLLTASEAEAIHAAVNRLLQLGHRSLAQFANRVELKDGLRPNAIEHALRASGLPDATCAVYVVPDEHWEAAVGEMAERIFRSPSRPTAVISNHVYILPLLVALGRLGLRVPDDVSVVSFSDPEWAQICTPPIATIRAECSLACASKTA